MFYNIFNTLTCLRLWCLQVFLRLQDSSDKFLLWPDAGGSVFVSLRGDDAGMMAGGWHKFTFHPHLMEISTRFARNISATFKVARTFTVANNVRLKWFKILTIFNIGPKLKVVVEGGRNIWEYRSLSPHPCCRHCHLHLLERPRLTSAVLLLCWYARGHLYCPR